MSDTASQTDLVDEEIMKKLNVREPHFGVVLSTICVIWSLFQLWAASDFPFYLSEVTGVKLVFNSQQVRQIHLAFGLGLALMAFPVIHSISPMMDRLSKLILAGLGIFACMYLFFLRNEIADRAGLPVAGDLFVSIVGVLCIGVAVYRSLGLPLVIVASVFVLYVFFGDGSWVPDIMRWKGASLGKATWHYWMQTEGVFGVALGVSASMIFLFVLFGSLLESAGAGNYFIKLSFSALGSFRGGPAKAAVVASGLSGIYSGSSIANVVTTGTFTIPLMKKTGFSAEKAGAVEVAASTNGQLTPPVMGAAAFLISEFTGISYFELIKYAALPALASYIALFYIVHLEVLKLNLQGLPKRAHLQSFQRRLGGFLLGFLGLGVLSWIIHIIMAWVGGNLPGMNLPTAALIFVALYTYLVRLAASKEDLAIGLTDEEMNNLPSVSSVAVTGYHFVLPIAVLLWCVLISRLSPALSAYWSCLAMIFVLVTQKPLKAYFRGQTVGADIWKDGVKDLIHGLESGARNMITIAVATGVAGIIIGTVSLTGAHQFIGEFVEVVSSGSLVAMLLLVAVMSLILGMGLPTTANYIVVSSLMAPVVVAVGAQNGLIVPLVAVHLFVFYFGILADDTPPVGLAAFAASAISRGDPIKTGIQGFSYDIRTAILPFMFIFNTDILLIGVGVGEGIIVIVTVILAMLAFSSAVQHYMLVKNRIWETLTLLLVAFTFFRPDFWLDQLQSAYSTAPGNEIVSMLENEDGPLAGDQLLRIAFEGPDFDDEDKLVGRNSLIELQGDLPAIERLEAAGIVLQIVDGVAIVDEPLPGSPLFQEMQSFDFYADNPVVLKTVFVENTGRLAKQLFHIPAALVLLLIYFLQRQRRARQGSVSAPKAA